MANSTGKRRKKDLPERVRIVLWDLARDDDKPPRYLKGKELRLVMRNDLVHTIKVQLGELKLKDRKIKNILRSLESHGHVQLSQLDRNSCWVVMPSQD